MTLQQINQFKSTPNQLFQFDNQRYEIRFFVDTNNDIWAVAKDIANVLNISNVRQNLKNIPHEWSSVYKTDGLVNFTIIKEPAIYRLIMRSNKPQALNFQRWVCEDILPSIRKSGQYVVSASSQPTKSIQLLNSQQETCKMLMKYFPNDDLVKERVKHCLISSLADSQSSTGSNTKAITMNQTFTDLTSILRDMQYPVNTKNAWNFSGLGGYISKKYRHKFKRAPKKSDKYCNGADRSINVYTNDEISCIKPWILEYFDRKPNFWQ